MHLRRLCRVALPIGLLVLTAGCGSSVRQAIPQPPDTAARVTHTPGRPPSTTTIPVLRAVKEVADVLAKLYPTTTTSTAVPRPNLVVPPRVQVGGTGLVNNPSCPPPISVARCPQFSQLFDGIFGCASAWAQSIAWRESRCTPTAANREGAVGLMQLLGHGDLLSAVCPSLPVFDAGRNATCNLLAAKRLFDADGTRPWSL